MTVFKGYAAVCRTAAKRDQLREQLDHETWHLADLIKAAIVNGASAAAVAEAAGISRARVYQICRGE
jgi:hypothetical protein